MALMSPQGEAAADLYEELPFTSRSKCIRILSVAAPILTETDGGLIRGTLEIVDLNNKEALPYTALTYTWGTKAEYPQSIICGGQSMEVTENCHAALVHLRSILGSFRIWVDAICINQHAPHEKMEQITLMGEIYARAATVYVWIGPGTERTRRALDYLRTCGYRNYYAPRGMNVEGKDQGQPRPSAAVWACVRDGVSFGKYPFPQDQRSQARSWLLRACRLEPSQITFDDLNTVLDVPWIKRMWTYQEIILASKPMIVCGQDIVPWDELAMGVVFLEFCGIHHHKPLSSGALRIPELEIWAKVALCRDQLRKIDNNASGDERSETKGDGAFPGLLGYQKFSLDFSRDLRKLDNEFTGYCGCILILVVLSGFAALIVFLAVFTTTTNVWTPPLMSDITTMVNVSDALSNCATVCRQNMTAQYCHAACAYAADAYSRGVNLTFQSSVDVRHWIVVWAFTGVWATLLLGLVICCYFGLIMDRPLGGLRPVLHPEGSRVDLASAICNREAIEDRDKAFALQAILQRLMSKELPVPDSSRPIPELYKELTLRIMEATNSLQLLIPAAVNSMDGRPSWVPYWCAKVDRLWLQPPIVRGDPPNATPGSGSYWKLHPQDSNILIVRGKWLCRVVRRFRFTAVQEGPYVVHERDAHLRNIKWLLSDLFKWHGRESHLSTEKFRAHVDELGLGSILSDREIEAWQLFFFTMRKAEASEVLEAFERHSHSSLLRFLWSTRYSNRLRRILAKNSFCCCFPLLAPYYLWLSLAHSVDDVLRTTTKICNFLARSRRAVFFARTGVQLSYDDRRWDEYTGAYGHEADTRAAEIPKRAAEGNDAEVQETKTQQLGAALKGFTHPRSAATAVWSIGLCNSNVKVGDSVVLISGVPLPLIVTHEGDKMRLVSPAVLKGTGRGDYWQQNWEEEDLFEFHLS